MQTGLILPACWSGLPSSIFAVQMTAPLPRARRADLNIDSMMNIGDAVPGGRLADFGRRSHYRGAATVCQTTHDGDLLPALRSE